MSILIKKKNEDFKWFNEKRHYVIFFFFFYTNRNVRVKFFLRNERLHWNTQILVVHLAQVKTRKQHTNILAKLFLILCFEYICERRHQFTIHDPVIIHIHLFGLHIHLYKYDVTLFMLNARVCVCVQTKLETPCVILFIL